MRRRVAPAVTGLVLASAALAPMLAGCSSGEAPPAPTTSTPAPPTARATSTSPAAPTGVPTGAPTGVVPAGALVPLWPFTSASSAAGWQAGYRADGRDAWHLDVAATALRFSAQHLGYREIDLVTSRSVVGADARIGVGRAGPDGGVSTAAVLHLVRLGGGPDAPWVVVGSDDSVLTLDRPGYGTTVRSPLTVGGRITGVDESLRVIVLGPASATPLAGVDGLPAGGERTPWSTTLRFDAPSGTVVTVAVSTGGHVATVERFAITAVRVA